ncbi:MAG: hypothetical protein DCC56_13680 [Anaerolineae bacterium]|nr:MAG: hypothetical protein DCC56_13680 [Anaerolineae bacterium]WKZ43239.1 MAG: hypothetical protein QY302_14150 [Anaerolineales bacterium]
MKITRDVVTDLLPVYLAGEASADTRALVEEFLKQNPEFAKLIAKEERPLAQPSIQLQKETEMKTLEQTKKLLAKRSWYMGFAIFFTVLPLSIRGNEQGIYWMWAGDPMIPITSVAVAVFMWFLYARTNHKLNGSGL